MGIDASSPVALLAEAVRRLGRQPAARPWLLGAYRGAARAGAAYLAGLAATRAVFVSGSMARDDCVVPGVSDIDLVLIAELPTLEAELAFRQALRARHGHLHAVAPVFHDLEYFTPADVPYLRAFPNGWFELDTRWQLLSGEPIGGPKLYRGPEQERRLSRFHQALLDWRKRGCHLLDSRLDAADWVLVRAAERTLGVTLAMWLDCDRHEPLDRLLAAAAIRGVARIGDDLSDPRARVRECLATTVEVLGRFAEEATSHWREKLHVTLPQLHRPAAEDQTRARALIAHGFASAHLVPLETAERGHRLVAVAPASDSSRELVLRAERALSEFPRATSRDRFPARPLILSQKLWQASMLLEPCPWLAAAVAGGAAGLFGVDPGPILAPPADELSALFRQRAVELFYRARGRMFRIGKRGANLRLAADLRLSALLSGALDHGELAIDPESEAIDPADERVQIAVLREFIAARQKALLPELERRTPHGAGK